MRSDVLKKIAISAAGTMLAAGILTFSAQADQWDKTTLLTLDQPTQVADTYLEPGTYMFKIANSEADREIVQIFNKDRSHLIDTIIAFPSYRVFPTSTTQITYWETPPGTARAVRDWYWPGDHFGEEFRYPTNLRQISAVAVAAPAPPPPAPPETAQVAPPPAAAAPEPPAQALEQAPAEQPPVEIAQNTPPPAPAPETPSQPEEQTLPKTASPYPLMGLGGLLALGLYGGLRIRRIA